MSDSTTTTATNSTPGWYKPVCWVALVWNLMGLLAFVAQATMSDSAMSELPQDQQDLYKAMPAWVNVAFAVAVIGGTLGCVALLLRRKVAFPLFVVSLLSVIVQNSYYFTGNVAEVMGVQAIIMPSLVIVIGILLLWLTVVGTRNRWLT